MTEFQMFIHATNGAKFKTTIIQYPTKKWSFVGDIPETLGYWSKNKIGQDIFCSNVYETREAAEKALNDQDAI